MLVEMGHNHGEDWYVHLPWVLLSRRVALMPDVGTSSSKLVLGTNPVVPGQLIGAPSPPMPVEHLKKLADHLEMVTNVPAVQTSNHDTGNNKNYMPTTTENATHVYLKKENPKGLMQSYVGPYRIVDRPSHSTIKVKVGVFKNGNENIQLHHWSNAKPAFLRENFNEAQMPVRGRPPKVSSPLGSAPSSVEPDTTVASDRQTNTDVDVSEPASIQHGGEINKRVTSPRFTSSRVTSQNVNNQNSNSGRKRPARTTRNPNPSYVDALSIDRITGPPPSPAFLKRNNMWSASAKDLYNINKAINSRQ